MRWFDVVLRVALVGFVMITGTMITLGLAMAITGVLRP
jgi:hypothetical protein